MFPSFNSLDQNPSSKQDHNPPFLFNFPSPFLDEHESPLSQIFLQNPSSDQNQNNTDLTRSDSMKDKVKEVAAPLKRRNLGVVPRRRTGKKDRHSKICTAQGIRDRRMRLSLQVARKFFDLQDMLGFDKASKTIEWLFSKSNKAIKELADDHHQANYNFSVSDAKSESFISECEVVSGLIHEENTSNNVENGLPKMERTASNLNARESREKARARARCRTRAKMMAKGLEYPGCKQNPNFGDAPKLGFSPYEAGLSSLEYPLADVSMIEKFLGNSSSSSTSSWGNSMLPLSALVGCANSVTAVSEPNCSFMGFFGNFDLGGNPNSIYSASGEFQ